MSKIIAPSLTRRLVLIEWVDSYGPGRWDEVDDDDKPRELCRVKSVGWLVQDDEDVKVLVSHVAVATAHTPLQHSGDMTIPTCAVTRVQDLIGEPALVNVETGEPRPGSLST